MCVCVCVCVCACVCVRVCVQHVLVLVYPDVDSLCACKILQTLFKADDVQHTVVCVPGEPQLKTAFSAHSNKVSPASCLLLDGLLSLSLCVGAGS